MRGLDAATTGYMRPGSVKRRLVFWSKRPAAKKIKEQRKNSAVAAAAAKKTISYAMKFAKKFAPAGIKRLSQGKNQSKIGGQQRKK